MPSLVSVKDGVSYKRTQMHKLCVKEMQIQIDVNLANIQQNQRNQSIMSIFTHFTGSNDISDLMARKYHILRALERQNLLKVLSIALRQSFSSFQEGFSKPKYAIVSQIPKKAEPAKIQSKLCSQVIEILSDEQETVRKQQNLLHQKRNEPKLQPKQPTGQLLANNQKNNEQNPTSDEDPNEESLRKGKSKQIKKRKESREIAHSVPLPEVDEIQTCYLPKYSLSRKEIETKKLKIMKRMVSSWQIDVKKQKRQIRMLKP